MAKRKRKQKTVLTRTKPKTYYPLAYCTHEDIPIAVSHFKCSKKVKVHWIHFDIEKGVGAEFRKGYEFSLKGMDKGEVFKCPKCDHPIDFRLWMSDTTPHIVEIVKPEDEIKHEEKEDVQIPKKEE